MIMVLYHERVPVIVVFVTLPTLVCLENECLERNPLDLTLLLLCTHIKPGSGPDLRFPPLHPSSSITPTLMPQHEQDMWL